METRITKRNIFEALLTYANGGLMSYVDGDVSVELSPEDLAEFAENELTLLDKKAAKAKERAAAKRAEGDELTEAVRAAMSYEEFEPIADIAARIEGDDVSVAKVQYRINQLVKAGDAVKAQIVVPGDEGQKARKLMSYKLIKA